MYHKKKKGWIKHLDFLLLDLLCLQISYLIAYWIRHGFLNMYAQPIYRNIAVVLFFLEIFVVILFGSLKNILKRGYLQEFLQMIKHVFLVSLLATFFMFLVQVGGEFSRSVLVVTAFLYLGLGYSVRVLWKVYLKKREVKNKFSRSLLILAYRDNIEETVKTILKHNYEKFYIKGIVVLDEDQKGREYQGIKVVANYDDAIELISKEWIDEVFFSIPMEHIIEEEYINKFVDMGITVHQKISKDNQFEGHKRVVERIANYTVLTTSLNIVNMQQAICKRGMDIVGGLIGTILAGILYVVIAPIIHIKSPGPVIFKQERIGKNGKKFYLYKFRSMYLDAEERKAELMAQNKIQDGMMFKMDWDPRIIDSEKGPNKGFGHFIRKYSIDEFPQFINVLKGDMSLVGTRPPTVDEWEKYELHHRGRMAFRPGLTGLWQVSGRSNIVDFEEVVKLDKQYIAEWNLGLDIRILLKTIGIVAKPDGAV